MTMDDDGRNLAVLQRRPWTPLAACHVRVGEAPPTKTDARVA